MPSSSNRTTAAERRIYQLFQSSYTHLLSTDFHPEATKLLFVFADLLDINPVYLRGTLQPSPGQPFYVAGLTSAAEYAAWEEMLRARATRDEEGWAQCFTAAGKLKKDSERISAAGEDLGRVGAVLFAVGMDVEAAQWCEWGEGLLESARQVAEREVMGAGKRRMVWDGDAGERERSGGSEDDHRYGDEATVTEGEVVVEWIREDGMEMDEAVDSR